MSSIEATTQLLGRLHPLAVHFPIGLILFAAAAEIFSLFRKNKEAHRISCVCFAAGAVGAAVASGFGWLLAAQQEFSGEAERDLFFHRWIGIGLAVFAALSCLLSFSSRVFSEKARRGIHAVGVLVTAVAVGITGHLGGKMVHGADYLMGPISELIGEENMAASHEARARLLSVDPSLLPVAAKETVEFERDIHPILEASCVQCHNEKKHKGEFRMDSREQLLRGGKSGKAVVPGSSAQSLLVHLVSGIDPERIMPSKGRRLTPHQIGLIRAWIDQGAKWGDGPLPGHTFAKAPLAPREVPLPVAAKTTRSRNPIDLLLEPQLTTNGVDPSRVVDDLAFARRASLDIVGLQPPAAVLRDFAKDRSKNKREKYVDSLLADSSGYASHWLSFWNDLLRNDYTGPGFLHGGRQEVTQWLYRSLAADVPYNRLVFDLTAQSPGAEGFLKGVRWWHSDQVDISEHIAMQGAQNVAQAFLGVNLKCASCHDSFTDAWQLKDAYGLANIFTRKGLETHRCNFPMGETVKPQFLFPELGEITGRRTQSRQKSLAGLLTDPKNGRFARTIVNRLWAQLFGRGIVHPIDELDHPPWNPDLLDWLANELVRSNYNLKHILRLMLTSEAYQLPAVPVAEQTPSPFVFRGPFVRRLTSEQILDSLSNNFELYYPMTSKDVLRAVRLTEEIQPSLTKSQRGPRVHFSTPPLDPAERPAVNAKADLSGARFMWIVAYPDYAISKHQAALRERQHRMRQASRERVGNAARVYHDENLLISEARFITAENKTLPLSSIRPDMIVSSSGANSPEEDLLREEETASVVPLLRTFGEKPLFAAGYRLEQPLKSFEAKFALESLSRKKSERRFRIFVLTDIEMRTAFLEATDLFFALGRPRREQIATSRESVASTVQAMELMQRPELERFLRMATERVMSGFQEGSTEELPERVFSSILGRRPTEPELRLSKDFLGQKPSLEAVEDLIWSLVVSPEFQFII